jgi:hypothetical protein
VDSKVIRMSLADFKKGFDGPATPDDVSITTDGRRLDSKESVLAWWAEVGSQVEEEEAAKVGDGGGLPT